MLEDKELAGLPSSDFLVGSIGRRLADNGTCLYTITYKEKEPEGEEIKALSIIADVKNSRKIIIKQKGKSKWYDVIWPNSFNLSDDGSRAVLNSYHDDYLIDLKSKKVVARVDGSIEAMDYDASVLVCSKIRFEEPIFRRFKGEKKTHYDYYRVDLKTNEITKLHTIDSDYSNYNINGFELSPDGNFAVTPLREFLGIYTIKGEQCMPPGIGFSVYDHSTSSMFSIKYVSRGLKELHIGNDGTIILPSNYSADLGKMFRLEYKEGNYVWATGWEKQPKNFSVAKHTLEGKK
jgi:hypothetical protein